MLHLAKRHSSVRTILRTMEKWSGSPSLRMFADLCDGLSTQRDYALQLIHQRKSELLEMDSTGQNSMKAGINMLYDSSDVLSLLLRANIKAEAPWRLSDDMLCNQITNILGAGHETTSSGVCWTLWVLANNLSEQQILREACQSVYESTEHPDWSQIKSIDYLDWVVLESLRLHPPTPRVARVATQSSFIDGVYIPKGTKLLVSNAATNRDELTWGKNSNDFVPSRWNPTSLPNNYDPRFSMMTFLAGPHACIGRQMAMMEMKAVLARLITQYNFTVAPEQLIAKPSMFRIVQPQISLIHCSVALMITSKIEQGLKLRVQKISS